MTSASSYEQYDRWARALRGEKLDLGERGDPPSGYFRFPSSKGQEAVAVWRNENGLNCWRNIFGDGSKMDADAIDMLFAGEHYVIPYDLFVAVTERGEEWPPEYMTRLRTKDINAGVVWTIEWARQQLSHAEINAAAENPHAVIGGNDLPESTPDQVLAEKIKALGQHLATMLGSWGGKPRNQAEVDQIGVYANKFKDFENEATAAHKAEKEPHLAAGRAVDSKWFGPVRDKAIASRQRVLAIAKEFIDAENKRRAEKTRVANEAARKAAESEAKITGETPAPVTEVVPEVAKVSTLRGRQTPTKVWTVTKPAKFATYALSLETPPPDLIEALNKLARKWGPAGVTAPSMELR